MIPFIQIDRRFWEMTVLKNCFPITIIRFRIRGFCEYSSFESKMDPPDQTIPRIELIRFGKEIVRYFT